MTTPEKIYGVSNTQFSIARHYGGCKFNGVHYTYNPADDTLIRDDVLRASKKEQRAMRKSVKPDKSGEIKTLFNEPKEW